MTKKIRLIIFYVCAVVFFIIAPYIIIYSLGYRIDFEQKKLVTTGGIYVRALPQGADVIVDSKISNRISLLSPTVFVQNLLPKQHSILIKKEGYFDYKKNLKVEEKEVARLERVILFKKDIVFNELTDKTVSPFLKNEEVQYFIIKSGNLYENNIEKPTAILKKVLSFKVTNNNIIWLNSDGFLYSSSQDGKTTNKLSQIPLKVDIKNSYKLTIINQNVFLIENNNLLLFNQETKTFETFYGLVKDLKISPDGQKILYYNDNEIMYSYLNSKTPEKIFLNRFSEKIGDCFWLNDNYLIFDLAGKIVISEIDNRDSINTITLAQAISPSDKILFNQEDEKLYILTENNILVSEKLLP